MNRPPNHGMELTGLTLGGMCSFIYFRTKG
jgi:hypothetical protein